jgi:hypothetical protein
MEKLERMNNSVVIKIIKTNSLKESILKMRK